MQRDEQFQVRPRDRSGQQPGVLSSRRGTISDKCTIRVTQLQDGRGSDGIQKISGRITALTYNGVTAAPDLPLTTAADIRAALESIAGSGNFEVNGGPLPAADVIVTFQGDLSHTHVSHIVAAGGSVTVFNPGGSSEHAVYRLQMIGTPPGGTWDLRKKGAENDLASEIAYDITAEDLQTALVDGGSPPGRYVCTGGPFPGTPIIITRGDFNLADPLEVNVTGLQRATEHKHNTWGNVELALGPKDKEVKGSLIPVWNGLGHAVVGKRVHVVDVDGPELATVDQTRLAQAKDAIPPGCWGKMAPLFREGDLFQLSVFGPLGQWRFTLGFYDGTLNEDGSPHLETTEPIAPNTGQRNLQNKLRALPSLAGDSPEDIKVSCSCGPAPTNAIYIRFEGPFAGKTIKLFKVTTTAEDDEESGVIVGYAKVPSEEESDLIDVLNTVGTTLPKDALAHIGVVDRRWEMISLAGALRYCDPFRSVTLTQVFGEEKFTSKGDGDSPWINTAGNTGPATAFQVTFTKDQLNAVSAGDPLFSDTLVMRAFDPSSPIIPGAFFLDESDDNGMWFSFSLHGVKSGSGGDAAGEIVSATLFNLADERSGTQYENGINNDPTYHTDVVYENPGGYPAGTTSHQYGIQYGDGGHSFQTPLSTGHNIADTSDDVIDLINDGNLGIAFRIQIRPYFQNGPFTGDLIIYMTGSSITVRYQT